MDAGEFKRIFLPFHKDLYRVAYFLTSNSADAEDLVQDLYLRLWLKRDEIGNAKQTLAYLTTMLRNLYIDSARHIKPPISHNVYELEQLSDAATPESMLIKKDNNDRIRHVIGQLTERERQIIRMHVEQELTYSNIETVTGLSRENLRVIMTQTKQKIRKLFISKFFSNNEKRSNKI